MELRRDKKSAGARQLSSGILRGARMVTRCEEISRWEARTHERPLGGGRPCVRVVGEGLLPVGLLLRQPANDRQHYALAVEGVDEDDDQDDEEGQINQLPQR